MTQDESAAAAWYLASARQGLAPAQYNMGIVLAEGRGVEADLPGAWVWFARAADQGHKPAAEARDYVHQQLTQEQRSEAEARHLGHRGQTLPFASLPRQGQKARPDPLGA